MRTGLRKRTTGARSAIRLGASMNVALLGDGVVSFWGGQVVHRESNDAVPVAAAVAPVAPVHRVVGAVGVFSNLRLNNDVPACARAGYW